MKEQTIQTLPIANDPALSTEIKAFLTALNSGGGPPLETMTPADARNVLVGAQKSVEVDISGIEKSEKIIVSDGMEIKLNIVRPEGATGALPVFIFIHGGGWVLGDYPTHERLVRDLVVDSGAAAVFVNYTPSPEAQYPMAINQIYAATKWVADNGSEINVDGKRLAIVGNSVGGNMTAAVTLMAKDKGGPEIKVHIMLWPVTDANFDTGSYHQFANDRFLTRDMMIWFWDCYTSDPEKRKEYYASPLQATLEQLKGLPPAVIHVAENDVLRDEGEAYARKLNLAGVKVSVARFDGLIHDYGMLNPLSYIPNVKSAILYAAAELKKHL
ncbi:MAG TPA: alpha/beta hydrolase [Mucilaginibacter sp.]|jgi:acetyl esterase/lipase